MNFLSISKQQLKNLSNRWHRFWFIEIDPFILGLYRFALGLFLTLDYLMLAPSWLKYYGPFGLSPDPVKSLTQYTILDPVLSYVTTDWVMWLYYAFSVFCAICLTFGLLGRLPIIWLWLSMLSMTYRNIYVQNGEDQVLGILLLFSMFLPLNASLNFKEILLRRKWNLGVDTKVTTWALRPLQIHFALIYALSIAPKLLYEPAWRDGTVIYYGMMSISFPQWPGLDIFTWGNAFLSRVLAFYSLLLEALFPLLVWFRKFRLPLICGAVFLQVGIGIFLSGVWVFNVVMVVALILFLPSRRTRQWLENQMERAGRRWWKKAGKTNLTSLN